MARIFTSEVGRSGMEADGDRGEVRPFARVGPGLRQRFSPLTCLLQANDPISKCARAQKDGQGFATLTEPWRRSV